MKVEVVNSAKKFEPITVQVTFEKEEEIKGSDGFAYRFDTSRDEHGSHNYVDWDDVCIKLREALRKVGY